jgi:short-subunit dehydrogenase
MKRILVIGATSAIAEATARLWAARGDRLYLLARDEERAQVIAADLRIRGAESVRYGLLDVNDFDRHEAAIDAAVAAMGGIDIVLVAHGTLGSQTVSEQDPKAALREFNTNAISVISLLTVLANRFEAQRHGTIAVIGSVAGDRGRRSNYVYGAAKAAVTTFLQGLRNRLHRSGVNVLTIKPGLVDTPMTKDFDKGALWAAPGQIAAGIASAVDRNKCVVYLPFFWRYIMLVIKLIPETVFKRTSL